MTGLRIAAMATLAGVALFCAIPARSQHFAAGLAAERPRFDCSRAPNPAKCDARRKEFRAQLVNAQNACEDKHGEEHHACMIRTMCQQARDPQQCENIARRRAEHRREIQEACAGRSGDELRNCVRNRMGYEEPIPPGGERED